MKTKINIEDRLLSQDRWIVGMIILGLFSFWVLIAESNALEQDQKKSPKQELQAISHFN